MEHRLVPLAFRLFLFLWLRNRRFHWWPDLKHSYISSEPLPSYVGENGYSVQIACCDTYWHSEEADRNRISHAGVWLQDNLFDSSATSLQDEWLSSDVDSAWQVLGYSLVRVEVIPTSTFLKKFFRGVKNMWLLPGEALFQSVLAHETCQSEKMLKLNMPVIYGCFVFKISQMLSFSAVQKTYRKEEKIKGVGGNEGRHSWKK